MKRSVVFITLVAVLLISGCAAFMNLSSSSFLTNVSLERLVRQNRSASGMICAQGGMGGMAGGSGGVGYTQSSINKFFSFACQITDRSFDEADFVNSLKADVEHEITRSGATIMDRGTRHPAEFHFEYSEGRILGRISIEGKKSGADYYSLTARLNETQRADVK
jgi:hypothetical protein